MADASYDAVIIGGGGNALVTGCYLAANGLSVAIFERHHELGGGICSEELPLPGFLSNPCAHVTHFHDYPVYSDFMLAEKGLDLILTDCDHGVTYRDGTSITTYPILLLADKMTGKVEFREENAQKTANSIAKVSQNDAEMFRFLLEKARTKWLPAIGEVTYTPPKPWGGKNAVERLMDDPDSGFEPVYAAMTLDQLARDLWESPEMQCYFIRRVNTTTGLFGADTLGPEGAMFAITLILSLSHHTIPIGGTHAIAHALQRAFNELGGKFFVHHEVDKVLIENGNAKGIRLVDGTEIAAEKMVISDLDIDQTINRLIGPDHVSPRIARRARNVRCDSGCIFWIHVALRELPRYKAEDYEPDFALCFGKHLLPKDPDYMGSKLHAELWVYGIPKQLALISHEDTRWVKTKAPQGMHNVLVEQYAAPIRFFSEKDWLRMKSELGQELIKQWQWYAPNVTKDSVISIYVNTPYDVNKRNINMREGNMMVHDLIASQFGRFRPIPELSGYRMPIKNMYLNSGATHTGGGSRSLGGYVCYKVIAQDFGLRKFWEEKGRPY